MNAIECFFLVLPYLFKINSPVRGSLVTCSGEFPCPYATTLGADVPITCTAFLNTLLVPWPAAPIGVLLLAQAMARFVAIPTAAAAQLVVTLCSARFQF